MTSQTLYTKCRIISCCAGISSLAGVVVIDVVEGTAIASLPFMHTVLQVGCCPLFPCCWRCSTVRCCW
jgi:hypothetical protein